MMAKNYFGLTIFSLFRELFIARKEKDMHDLEIKNATPVNVPPVTDGQAPPAIPNPNEPSPPPPQNIPPAPQGMPPIPPIPAPNFIEPAAATRAIATGMNIKVVNAMDEYGNFNKLGIVTNVLDPRKDEQALGITEKKYYIKMPDGKIYPYLRNEIEIL